MSRTKYPLGGMLEGGDNPPGGTGDWNNLKDPKAIARWNALKQKYAGSLPKINQDGAQTGALDQRMDWMQWAGQKLPTSGTPAELAKKAAQVTGFKDPGLLLSSAMEEGVGNRFKGDDAYSQAYADAKIDQKKFPVDGFRSYGLDQIGGRVDEFIQKGYLPKDFKSKMATFKASNENDEQEYYKQLYNVAKSKNLINKDFQFSAKSNDDWTRVYDKLDQATANYKGTDLPKLKQSAYTAAFSDDQSAFTAKAAFMRAEQDNISSYAKKKGYNLTPEEQNFFTLASYNGGSGNGQQMLDYYGSKKELGNNGFLKDKMKDKGQIYDNVLPRYAGAKLFNSEGYFKMGGEISGGDDPRDGMIKAAIGNNYNKEFVRRMYDNTVKVPIKNNDGSMGFGSHFMAQSDNIAYPTVIMKDGKLVQVSPEEAHQDAIKNNNFIKFNNEDDALYFTENYKRVTGMDKRFKDGGKMRPKYDGGGEIDPLTGLPLMKPSTSPLKAENNPVPINPDAPKDQQIFRVVDNKGTVAPQSEIVPLSQFYDSHKDSFGNIKLDPTGKYTNDSGQVNTVTDQNNSNVNTSVSNLQNAYKWEDAKDNIELPASIGISAINSFFNKNASAKTERTNMRRAILNETQATNINPYAQGTGSQAIMKNGGEIQGDDLGIKTLDGGNATLISSSDHSNPMVEFKGKEHKDGGIGIAYGGKIAEVEDKEVGWVDKEGGLNIFGKLKLPGTNTTFRKAAKDIAEQEAKVDAHKSKYLNILNNSDISDSYQQTAQSTAKVMFKSLDNQAKDLAEKKEAMASYQNLILNLTNGESDKMKYGGRMPRKPYAGGGTIGGPDDPIVQAKLTSDFARDERDLDKVKSVTLHKTAGDNDAASVVAGWNSDKRQASADYIIDKDGTITQTGDLRDTKWGSGRKDVNKTSIQVEIVGKSADESDMTDAQYKALARLHKDVFAPMGISPNDYFGHTQVNPSKGFDFPKASSIKNVLSKAGISNDYVANTGRYMNTTKQDLAAGDPYPKNFKTFIDKKGNKHTAPAGLDPSTFYKDPEIVAALKKDQTFPKADADSVWGIEHDNLWNSLSQDKKNKLLRGSKATSYIAPSDKPDLSPSGTTNAASSDILNFTPKIAPIEEKDKSFNTKYGMAHKIPANFNDIVNINSGDIKRSAISPLAIEQIAPELLTMATNRRDKVTQLNYQPDLKQTFDLSYQLGRNENQSSFNQVAKMAESTGNIEALSQLAASKYKADEQYNMQEVQGNAQQKLQTYAQNTDTLNDAQVKNLALISDQQQKQAQAKFNTRKEDIAGFTSIAGKVLQNNLENKTYNAYANLFKHYGFDKKGNVTFNPDNVVTKFNAGEAAQFGMLSAQKGAAAIMNGDYSRQFTNVKNSDGSTTTTETLGKNKAIQERYKTLKNQGFDDDIIGNMLRAEYPETVNQ